MVELSVHAYDVLAKASDEKFSKNIPFYTYSDMRVDDLKDAPDFWYETDELRDAIDVDNFQLIIGANGSGKSLLLRHQEVKFLETYGNDSEVEVLPVWFDAQGLTSFDKERFKSENQFHMRITRRIIEATLKTIKNLEKPGFWKKRRFKTFQNLLDEPIHKKITKTGKKGLSFGDLTFGFQTGKKTEEDRELEFNIDYLIEFLEKIHENYNITVIKVLVDETSTLTIYDDDKQWEDTTYQKWFFNFIDKCRLIKATKSDRTGLSFSIAVLPSRMELGDNLKLNQHIKPINLDLENNTIFHLLSREILDKRITFYTDERFKSFTDIFKGNVSKCPSKDHLEKASSWIPRNFLDLCQQSFLFLIKANLRTKKKKHNFITKPVVEAVLIGYAKKYESQLKKEHLSNYRKLVSVVSESGKARFIFEVDENGEFSSSIKDFIHQLEKGNIIIKKSDHYIFNQAIWLGTKEKVKRELKFQGNIPVYSFSEGEFIFKKEKKLKEKVVDEIDKFLEEQEDQVDEEYEELEEIPLETERDLKEGSREFFESIADDLEMINITFFLEKSEMNFPFSDIKKIFRRYSNRAEPSVYNHCYKIVRKKTYSIIKDLIFILQKESRKNIKPEMIYNVRSTDDDLISIPQKYDLVFKPNRIKRILKELWPSAGIIKEAYEPFLRYIEDWLSTSVLKAIQYKEQNDPNRKTLQLEDFQRKENDNVLRIEWKDDPIRWKQVPEEMSLEEAKKLIKMGVANWEEKDQKKKKDNIDI